MQLSPARRVVDQQRVLNSFGHGLVRRLVG
jgi:hypothetical protein